MTDHAFEDFLRTSLASAVEGAGAPPLATRTKRRVRMRQAALLGAAGLVALVGTFGAVRAGAAVFAGDDIPPAGPSEELTDERGSGGTYPCAFDTGPGAPRAACVAAGERDGLQWKLGVSLDPAHGLCLTLETVGGPGAAGAGSGCGEYHPGRIGLDRTGIEGLPMLAYGQVPAETERLVLEHGADDSFELEIYPAPRGFALDVGFYLVWLPDDAVRLVAYDSAGEVVTSRAFDGGPSGNDPERTENVEVGDGSIDGSPWVLEAYGVRRDGREIVCTRVLIAGEETQDLAPCDASFGRASVVGVTPFSSSRLPEVVAVGGVTTSKTGSVTFVTAGGDAIDATVIEPPPKIEQTLRFFVAFAPVGPGGEAAGTIVVRDRSGEVVEERDFCVPGGEGLSC